MTLLAPARARHATIPLHRTHHAPAEARHIVAALVAAWRIPAVDLDDVRTVVSELTTNGVRYPKAGPGGIDVHLRVNARRLTVAVHDGDPRFYQSEARDEWAEGGRGLDLVKALSDGWGVRADRAGGKNVFATWELPGAIEHNCDQWVGTQS